MHVSHNPRKSIARPRHLLPTVAFAQFAGTSLWFAVNAVLPALQLQFPDFQNFLPAMTAAVQLGFALLALGGFFGLGSTWQAVWKKQQRDCLKKNT